MAAINVYDILMYCVNNEVFVFTLYTMYKNNYDFKRIRKRDHVILINRYANQHLVLESCIVTNNNFSAWK